MSKHIYTFRDDPTYEETEKTLADLEEGWVITGGGWRHWEGLLRCLHYKERSPFSHEYIPKFEAFILPGELVLNDV